MIYFGAVVLKAYAWLNDHNSTTQHIATLLTQYLQALAKRSQHFDATYRNIVGRNMLRAFGHRVATRCGMLRVKIKQCACPGATLLHEPGQTTTTSCNIHKCCMKNMTSFKFEPTIPNMSQHIAKRGIMVAKRAQHVAPNNVAICCVEILRSFGWGFTLTSDQLLQLDS